MTLKYWKQVHLHLQNQMKLLHSKSFFSAKIVPVRSITKLYYFLTNTARQNVYFILYDIHWNISILLFIIIIFIIIILQDYSYTSNSNNVAS